MDQKAFQKWFDSHDFWKPNSAREALMPVWQRLEKAGLCPEETAETLTRVVETMRDEYGD